MQWHSYILNVLFKGPYTFQGLISFLLFLVFIASVGAGNLKARFENMAKASDEENKKRADEERARRLAREKREREEAQRKQEVKFVFISILLHF